ncbi:MAG: alpha/beta fold hydrolase [Hydrogenophaga sp.]|nr:alpha/beta fold hydrolase [Hydrogenophaga sp.]
MKTLTWGLVALSLLAAALWTGRQFRDDMAQAKALSSAGSVVLGTRCGPIEVQQAGEGMPLLVVHGSGGGHDQGMAWAKTLTQHGVRVIAVSRFGYLRTPRPADASPEAQADAHVCVLDALGMERAAVMGVSAGSPSALQTAIRHPARVSALVLVVPIAWKPGDVVAGTPPISDRKDTLLLRLLGSDLVFWAGLKLARDQVIRHVLATPPELVADASASERVRVHEAAERILPVSARAQGLHDDTRLGKSLQQPYALGSVQAPTLVVSARDDAFGTYAPAAYTASQIPGARFIGFEQGGHLLVGHDPAVREAVLALLGSIPSTAQR